MGCFKAYSALKSLQVFVLHLRHSLLVPSALASCTFGAHFTYFNFYFLILVFMSFGVFKSNGLFVNNFFICITTFFSKLHNIFLIFIILFSYLVVSVKYNQGRNLKIESFWSKLGLNIVSIQIKIINKNLLN